MHVAFRSIPSFWLRNRCCIIKSFCISVALDYHKRIITTLSYFSISADAMSSNIKHISPSRKKKISCSKKRHLPHLKWASLRKDEKLISNIYILGNMRISCFTPAGRYMFPIICWHVNFEVCLVRSFSFPFFGKYCPFYITTIFSSRI